MMKKVVLLLLGAFLFVACKKEVPFGPSPMFTNVSGAVQLTFPDGTKVEASSHMASEFAMDWDENCHYRTFTDKSTGKRVAVVFARSRKYSYEENPALKSLMYQHFIDWEEDRDRIFFVESDFYQVYQLKIEDQVVYQNDKALSDTVWDKWLNDSEAYYSYVWNLRVELNADNTLKSSACEELYSPKPQ